MILGAIVLLPMAASGSSSSFTGVLHNFLPSVEGFNEYPVWDVKQWSWGYGTAAGYDPNRMPAGSITREKAWQDALQVINDHYNYLRPLIKVDLKPNQWAALLSFSYNLGPGNADNLVTNINNRNTAALEHQWKQYIYADGQVNQGLINRRNKEWILWIG